MSTGETVAVKVLATNSKQGEKEFHTEVKMFTNNHLAEFFSLRDIIDGQTLNFLKLRVFNVLFSSYAKPYMEIIFKWR